MVLKSAGAATGSDTQGENGSQPTECPLAIQLHPHVRRHYFPRVYKYYYYFYLTIR